MCRWLAYSGTPILLEELLYRPRFSLIDQSMHARQGVETTNGDGFGVGWYSTPAHHATLFRGVGPAWGDVNLRELAGSVSSPLFLAHIRASTGTAVQQTNCHPFRYGDWMWVHNGSIRGFAQLKRELVLAVEPGLYPYLDGSTDSEVMFHLALTFGLRGDPVTAVERMVGYVEFVGRAHGVPDPVQMTVGTTDG
jgi:predicted glutamine amidotransferase